ncbi:MAG: fimbrial biogenesis outer membrane usher protein [Hydrogenophaga sp.]|nr:fimbrial biogenesis outer membrane usher protein [Hydrogenophaga sp.]
MRRLNNHRRRLFSLLPALLGAAALAHAQPAPRLIEVWLNGQRVDTFAPLMEDAGQWYAPAVQLSQWRLRTPDAPRFIDGTPHHSLQSWQPRLDVAAQRLVLDAPVADFLTQRVQIDGVPVAGAPVIEPLPGVALDYTSNLESDRGVSRHATLLDLRAFGWSTGGLLRASGVLRGGVEAMGMPRWQRLDTAWTQADPDGLRRGTVGDTITCSGELAPALRFAGVQYGTDFALRPDLVTQPLPAVQGSAQVPSGVDLLVNGRPAGSASVGPGRYTLDTLPGVTGAGEIRVVQRDVLGQETVQTVPYYVSPRLLRPGLMDACGEAGVLRRGYATAADNYRDGFVAGTVRRGIGEGLTVLARAEVGQHARTLHTGVHWVPARVGVLSAQFATSQTDGVGRGQRTQIGFERIERRGTLNLTVENNGANFRLLDGSALPRQRVAAFAGTSIGQTTVSGGAIRQRDAMGQRSDIFTASLQRRVGAHWHAGVNLFRRESNSSVAVLFTRALDTQTSVAVRAQAGDQAGLSAQAQRNEPTAGGLGWRLQGGSETLRALAGVSYLGDAGRVELQAARWRDDPSTHWRATAQGGVMWFGGAPVIGRPLGDTAAARVELEDLPGVGVQLNHREVAVTDARGHAWVWGLLPWQDNTVGIAADVLPLDVAITVPELSVRPPAQTAVRVRFPAHRTRSALLVVQRPGGEFIAPGSRALLLNEQGETTEAPEAGAPFAHGGQVWIGNARAQNILRIDGPLGVCHVRFAVPDAVPMATIGPLTCTLEIPR